MTTVYCLDNETKKHLHAARKWREAAGQYRKAEDFKRAGEAMGMARNASTLAIQASLAAAERLPCRQLNGLLPPPKSTSSALTLM